MGTLLSNLQIGLETRKFDTKKLRARAIELIEKVGLSGFENHYPMRCQATCDNAQIRR